MHTQKRIKAQILVIVILVLFLLSIIVMGIVAIVTRDIEQSLSASQYESSINKSEEAITKIVDKYGDVSVPLSGLTKDPTLSCTSTLPKYSCGFSEGGLQTNVVVEDTNKVEDYELGKDETFRAIVDGYTGPINISWIGNVAMEFTLEYADSAADVGQFEGYYQVIKDVYDADSYVLDSNGNSHPLNYNVPEANANKVTINLAASSIPQLASPNVAKFLKIRALTTDNTATLLTIEANNSFPVQIRKLEAATYPDTVNSSVSVPILITQIPIGGKLPGVLDYVLRSETEVSK